ncbi:MAG TPA: CAP domain-containing protein [Ardenticatenaceae bacterium]|jgi:uncharacterized protein YkwD
MRRDLFVFLLFVTLASLSFAHVSIEASQFPDGTQVSDQYLPIALKAEATPTPTPTPTPAEVPTVTATPTTGTDPFERRVIELTNEHRREAGCPDLARDDQLTTAARNHSADMALNDFFSHVGSNGSTFTQRIEATGYQWSNAAENIAVGYSSPEAVVEGWMNSQDHHDNILNCALREIGVGYYYLANDTGEVNYRHYWTQVFATPP